MTTPINDLLTVASLGTPWRPPRFPPSSDSIWKKQFARSDELGKRNIAHAWLWTVVHQEAQMMDRALLRNFFDRVFLTDYQWTALIQPYFDLQVLTADIANMQADEVRRYFDRDTPKPTGYQYFDDWHEFKVLWLGSEPEKQAVVSAMLAEPGKIESITRYPQALKMIWSLCHAVDAPSHRKADAAWIACAAGGHSRHTVSTEGCSRELKDWYQLGHLFRNTNNNFSLVKTKKMVASLHARVARHDPAIAALVMQRLLKSIDRSEKWVQHTRDTIYQVLAQSPGDKSPSDWDMLRQWVPSRVGVWNSYEAMGYNTAEAVAAAVELQTTDLSAPLPAMEDTFDNSQ